jgi:hypothetical protein
MTDTVKRWSTLMEKYISHDFDEESPEAKARWFQSLTLQERMDLLCAFTGMILSANPRIIEQCDVEPIAGHICVPAKS